MGVGGLGAGEEVGEVCGDGKGSAADLSLRGGPVDGRGRFGRRGREKDAAGENRGIGERQEA